MSELDNKLQELAKTDWETFFQLVGPNAILTAKARILRKEGKSYRQISVKLEMTESQVRHACNKKGDKN